MLFIDIDDLKAFTETEWLDFFDGLDASHEITVTEAGEPVSVFLSVSKAEEIGLDLEDIEEIDLGNLGELEDEDFYGYNDH